MLIVKRLVKRESINVQFDLPGGNREYDIKAGSNLRGEMIRLDVPVRAAELRPSAPREQQRARRHRYRVLFLVVSSAKSRFVHTLADVHMLPSRCFPSNFLFFLSFARSTIRKRCDSTSRTRPETARARARAGRAS